MIIMHSVCRNVTILCICDDAKCVWRGLWPWQVCVEAPAGRHVSSGMAQEGALGRGLHALMSGHTRAHDVGQQPLFTLVAPRADHTLPALQQDGRMGTPTLCCTMGRKSELSSRTVPTNCLEPLNNMRCGQTIAWRVL